METPPLPFIPQPKPLKKPDLFDHYKYYILGTLVFITGIGVYLMLTPPTSTLASDDAIVLADSSEPEPNPSTASQVVIDVAGGVQKPGVYWLNSNSIVEDAITAAGGFSSAADMEVIAREINRAGKLEANAKVYLPRKGDSSIVLTSSSTYSPTTTNQAKSLININTAQNSELDLLPGVGPVTAQRIIDYRIKNGNFKTIDDIKKVAGISDAKFKQLKDLISAP